MLSLQKFFIILVFITSPLLTKADAILGQFMPYYFFDELTYIETTQEKLLNTTNAEEVFSFDYVLQDEIFASVYATQTQGETYNRHINVFRRSEGFALVEIETIDVEQYTFLLSKYMDINNEESYVLAFSLEFFNGQLELHSHWSPNQINTIHRLYNYEIVFYNREDVLLFLPLMINKIQDITDLNMVTDDFICPKLYVSEYEFINDELQLTMHNEIGEEWIVLNNEDVALEIQLDEELTCNVSIPWEGSLAAMIQIENVIDFQEDLLFVTVNNRTTSTIELEDFHFDIFPNPTTDYINIRANGSIQLVDIMGRIIYSIPIVHGEIQLDVSNLPRNQYFLLHTHKSQTETKEVIVM